MRGPRRVTETPERGRGPGGGSPDTGCVPAAKETNLWQLWRTYARTRCANTRNQLILTYAPLVKYIAGRLCSTLPDHVEKSELVSDGLVGLIEAVDRYRPGEGVRFESFAAQRIRG